MLAERIASEPRLEHAEDGKLRAEYWDLPTDRAFLEEFLGYIFKTHWDKLIYGPIIDGAAYEMTCPCPPTICEYSDGYLTINFNGPHFHLCIDEMEAGRKDPELGKKLARRLPGRAHIQRSRDAEGAPISWSFSMWNSADEPMMSIFFASPFALPGDRLLDEPDFSRLAMWRDIAARYLGREPEAIDETSKGFKRFRG